VFEKPFLAAQATRLCRPATYLFSVLAAPVAQTCSLLYRRFLTCRLPAASNVLPIRNRQYGRLKMCPAESRYPATRRTKWERRFEPMVTASSQGCSPRFRSAGHVFRVGFRESGFETVVARASRPCVPFPLRTGGTPVPLPWKRSGRSNFVFLTACRAREWLNTYSAGRRLERASRPRHRFLKHALRLGVRVRVGLGVRVRVRVRAGLRESSLKGDS